MDYKYWCDFLTDEEFKNWEIEILMSNSDFMFFENTQTTPYPLMRFGTFKSFITSSFCWSSTKQGHEYWSLIRNRSIE